MRTKRENHKTYTRQTFSGIGRDVNSLWGEEGDNDTNPLGRLVVCGQLNVIS